MDKGLTEEIWMENKHMRESWKSNCPVETKAQVHREHGQDYVLCCCW